MREIPPLVEMVDEVPCPDCGGSGQQETGRVAGNAHEPAEPILETCRFCQGGGRIAPVMLDEAFDDVR